ACCLPARSGSRGACVPYRGPRNPFGVPRSCRDVATTILAQSLGTKYLLDAHALGRIREVLQAGGLIVYPTDTAYGLAADPFQPKAVDRLFAAKARPRDQAISMAVAGIPEVFRFGERTPIAQAFSEKNLPGPYTVVLRATAEAPRPI